VISDYLPIDTFFYMLLYLSYFIHSFAFHLAHPPVQTGCDCLCADMHRKSLRLNVLIGASNNCGFYIMLWDEIC
jgi:hypothetical protein